MDNTVRGRFGIGRECAGCTEEAVVLGCPVHDAAAALLSPDCRDGNHRKCDGIAWDMVLDAAVGCRCACHYAGQSAAAAA